MFYKNSLWWKQANTIVWCLRIMFILGLKWKQSCFLTDAAVKKSLSWQGMSTWILSLSSQFSKHTNCGSVSRSQTCTSIPGIFCKRWPAACILLNHNCKTIEEQKLVSSSCLLYLVLIKPGCLKWNRSLISVCMCLQLHHRTPSIH